MASHSAVPTMHAIAFDCPDPPTLAAFYAELLDGELDASDDHWCTVQFGEAAPHLAFQRVEKFTPPDWPDGTPQQVHLDLDVPDLEEARARAVGLGARVLADPVEEPGCTFIVLADPVGHPFCLCRHR